MSSLSSHTFDECGHEIGISGLVDSILDGLADHFFFVLVVVVLGLLHLAILILLDACTSLDLVIEHPYFWTAWAVSPILTWIHTKSMGFLRPF